MAAIISDAERSSPCLLQVSGDGSRGLGRSGGARGCPVVLVVLYIQQIDYMSIQYNTIQYLCLFGGVSIFRNSQGTLSELTRPRRGRLQGTI